MDTPNLLKGSLYSSSRVSRCPRFHACIACKKCQNFDRHQLECVVCESRVYPKPMVCDHLPEGEIIPDIQNTIKTVEIFRAQAMTHPDHEGQIIDGKDITEKYHRARRAADIMNTFLEDPGTTMEEKVNNFWGNPEHRENFLGKKL